MKRFTLALLAVATLLVCTIPGAAAKKPTSPAESPTQYSVEITSTDAVATSCGGILEVTRSEEPGGGATHFESTGAALAIEATGLNSNGYQIAAGCHGSLTAPEYFRITLEDDGSVAILWIFDVEVHESVITLKNGKQRIETTRDDFRMGGPYDNGDFAQWNQTTATTADGKEVIHIHGTGQFNFVHYQSGGHEEIADQPLFVDVGAPIFTLDITLTEEVG
jgi:hypothetical protein